MFSISRTYWLTSSKKRIKPHLIKSKWGFYIKKSFLKQSYKYKSLSFFIIKFNKIKTPILGNYLYFWWLQRELNQRHKDFQSSALPTELWSQMAVPTGFEPVISCVTGKRDRPLHYGTIGCGRRIWTYDLRVMSPTSYQTATIPRYKF